MSTSLSSRPRVFLDVNIGAEPAGRLTIELFTDKAPKTCENFRALCVGSNPPLTYKLSPFHRIIDEFMVQGGDITKGDGTGGASIYGGEFQDENLDWRGIDKAGLVCMANRGKGTNSSQWFITLAACEHLNGKHTIFGHLVSGQDTLDRMAKVDVDDEDRPITSVIVGHCGELERRKKAEDGTSKSSAKTSQATSYDSDSRGRRKRQRPPSAGRSNSRSLSRSGDHTRQKRRHTASRTPSVSPEGRAKQGRRSSDYIADENLRGRERRRAKVEKQSSPDRHDRRRSPSPSRAPRREYSRSPGYRRRRSLPNHYEKHREDEETLRDEEMRREGDSERFSGVIREDVTDRRGQHGGEGRLGGARWEEDGSGGQIRFKGRGSMKYRERG